MSQGADLTPQSRTGGFIRNPQDFWGGLALVILAALTYWAADDLGGMRGFAFGPGTAPRLFAIGLLIFGAIIVVLGVLTDGPLIERYDVISPSLLYLAYILYDFLPSTTAHVIAAVSLLVAIAWAIHGLRGERSKMVRGPLAISVSLIFFALAIRPLGLVIASFLMFVISAAASEETRWMESTIAAAVLTAFCVFLFQYALGLPFQLWPRFF
jgi:putative tricarboxylic transport membrane protein